MVLIQGPSGSHEALQRYESRWVQQCGVAMLAMKLSTKADSMPLFKALNKHLRASQRRGNRMKIRGFLAFQRPAR